MTEAKLVEKVARAIWDERELQFPPHVRSALDEPMWNARIHKPGMLDQAHAAISACRPIIEANLLRVLIQSLNDMGPRPPAYRVEIRGWLEHIARERGLEVEE